MKLTKISISSHRENTLDIPTLDEKQYEQWVSQPRKTRPYVQEAFPHLTAAEREFILSGTTSEEFHELFGDPE